MVVCRRGSCMLSSLFSNLSLSWNKVGEAQWWLCVWAVHAYRFGSVNFLDRTGCGPPTRGPPTSAATNGELPGDFFLDTIGGTSSFGFSFSSLVLGGSLARPESSKETPAGTSLSWRRRGCSDGDFCRSSPSAAEMAKGHEAVLRRSAHESLQRSAG